MIYIGIDPGASGGIAMTNDSGHTWTFKLANMTERDVWEELHAVRISNVDGERAIIEQVHSMPKQGVASTFKFGVSYGGLRMALVAAGIPFESVTPAKWQGFLGCRTGGDKNVTKAKAQELFPGVKVTHAVADALLLAEYARRTHGRG